MNEDYNKEYYAKNKEAILKQKREYRKNNKEKIKESRRKYYIKNPCFVLV
jgi:hypothetical protein